VSTPTARRAPTGELARFFEFSHDLFCVADPAGQLLEINQAFTAWLGWSRKDLLGQSLFSFVHPDDVATARNAVAGIMSGVGTVRFESRCRGRDGSFRRLSWSAHPVPTRGVMCAIAQDVTPPGPAGDAHGQRAAMAGELERRVAERTDGFANAEQVSRATIDALTNHIAVLAPNGTILTVNRSWRQFALVHGVDPRAVGEGKNYLDVCDRAAAAGVPAAAEAASSIRAIAAGIRDHVTFTYPLDLPGRTLWFLCRIARFPGDGLSPVVVSHVDITEERLNQMRLERSERRLSDFFECAPDPYIIVNQAGQIVAANARVEATFGWKREELVGAPVEVLVPTLVRSKHMEHRAQYVRQPVRRSIGMGHGDLRVLKRDGTECRVDISLSPIESGDELLVAASIRDLTPSLAMAHALRENEARYRQLVENAFEVFLHVELRGEPPPGRLVFMSRKTKEITGYEPDAFLGEPGLWRSLVHPEDLSQLIESTATALERRQPAVRTYRVRHVNGEYHTVEDQLSPTFDADGKITGYTGVIRDITERQQLEAQLRQSQRMESVGLLAGGIAHDFNNLLTMILGAIDLAATSVPPEHAVAGDLREARHAASTAADLTRQLLAFSRQQVLQPRVLDLTQVITQMLGLLRRLIGSSIEVVFRPGEQAGHVRADRAQIEQVLTNLVLNARDAMPDGGAVTIETSNVTVSDRPATPASVPPGDYVCLTVTDTGVGMDGATQARVFEPFFTSKGGNRGSGLGLSTVYGIVQQSGGGISVSSTPGQGATFRILLPRVDQPVDEAPERSRAMVRPGRAETILVVEDDPRLLRLAQRMLEAGGYAVVGVASGRDALQVLQDCRHDVQLVFTDLVMADMSGADLAHHVAEQYPGMKVLLSSGYVDDARFRAQVVQPGTHFIGKPYTHKTLNRKVRDVLDA
jgi:PAS domain S-box-containing protein